VIVIMDAYPFRAPRGAHVVAEILRPDRFCRGYRDRRLLERTVSFAGGVAFSAAEAVCRIGSSPADPLAGADLAEALITLVELHLLRVDDATTDDGEPRFRMLETIREYGREQLETTGEAALLRARHSMHYLTWAEQDAIPHTWTYEQAMWLDRVEDELGNLRVALAWCVDRGQGGDGRATEQGLVVGGTLFHFWYLRGHHREALTWLARLLAVPCAGAPTRGRGLALYAAAMLAAQVGARAQLHTQGPECLAILRGLDEAYDYVFSLIGISACHVFWPRPGTTDSADALAGLQEALAFVQGLPILDVTGRVLTAHAHIFLAQALLLQGDLANAKAHLEQALAVERVEGLHWIMSVALTWRGIVAQVAGDLAGASSDLERAHLHAAAIRDRSGMGAALMLLGEVAQQSGDRTAARRWYTQALLHFQPIGYIEFGMQAWTGLAEVALAAGEPLSALRLISAAGALTDAAGMVLRADVQARLDQVQAAAAQVLSEAEQAAARAAGQTMTVDQVIAEAARAW